MNNDARQAILGSIRAHLAASVPYNNPVNPENPVILSKQTPGISLVELFKQNLESVGARCSIARSDTDIADFLTRIIKDLNGQRIAISDDAELKRLLYMTDLEIEELGIAPNRSDIFRFDVGITSVQASIAETGTLVLDSANEHHRLVSLVPPVHIALVNGSTICETLGDALTLIRKDKTISPAVTFITGPSRTADIELTLTVGVHGPRELYVIISTST